MNARPLVVLEALAVRGEATGVAAGAVELVRALAAAERRCDFLVLAGDAAPFAWLAARPGWEVRAASCERPGEREWIRQVALPALCRRRGALLVHSLQPVAPWAAPCPVLLTVHDLAWRTMPGVIAQPRRSWLRLAVPASLRRASLLLANSGATAAALAREYPGLAARIRTVPHGTPAWALETPSVPPAAPGRPFYLFVGRLEPRKNLPRLLDAYELVLGRTAGQGPDLCLAGPDGWGLDPVRERLARPSLAGRVRVAGWCAPDALRDLYRTATALAFPSLDEGFGLPILEAMGCGLPVVTSDRGAMAEVAGSAALLVDPADVESIAEALLRAWRDGELRRNLAAAGRQRAAEWSWKRTAGLTTEAYDEIADRLPPK